MPVYGTYCDLTELKNRLSISGTASDSELRRLLQDISRWIDEWCGRRFYVEVATKYYTPRETGRLLIDDLLSITTLKTDDDGDRTYENTWAAADYDLEPYNTWPKHALAVTPEGNYDFPKGIAKGVEIAGQWGHGDGHSATPYEDSATNTNEVLDASETAVDVVDGTLLAIGQTILIESEQMYITGIATNTLTVVRGVNGTTAAAHVTDKDVFIYRYPGPVYEAALLQATRMWHRKDAPFGITGSGEFGQMGVIARLDPDVRFMLNGSRRIEVV